MNLELPSGPLPLSCHRSDGDARIFYIRFGWDNREGRVILAASICEHDDLSTIFFDAEFVESAPDTLDALSVSNHGSAELRGWGVMQALYLLVVRLSNRNLRSGQGHGGAGGDYRTIPSEHVWRGLVDLGYADHDPINDRYILRRRQEL